ncbi:MAG TPA: hypothetical protein VIL86_13990 [Tepidisphaeraceae bacterium]|jgi:hypothetical protein
MKPLGVCQSGSIILVSALLTLTAIGCAGRPSLIPNPDASLRMKSTEFAADAAKRHPFKEDAPHAGKAVGLSQVEYVWNRLQITNLSNEDWQDIEVWVNRQYVVHVPKLAHGSRLGVLLPFQMIYDDKGANFPTDNRKLMIQDLNGDGVPDLELYMNGKIYTVDCQLAD